jgi:hypothetical protein
VLAYNGCLCCIAVMPGGMQDCSPNSTSAHDQYYRRGDSGGSSNNKFDDSKDEYGKF